MFAVAVLLWASCGTDSDSVEAPAIPAEMMAAMQRDLGQTREEIERRLVAEAIAAQLEPEMPGLLGDAYGGAWMNADGSGLVVGITDASLADEVRAAGAEPQVVARSRDDLRAEQATLDATPQPASMHAWYVDVAANRVVVVTDDSGAERPRPFHDVRGGDEIILGGNILCSMGFAVDKGYVTAGHCGGVGTQTSGSNWVASGTVRGSQFPTHDWAWVELNSQWQSLPYVGNHAGGQVAVAGSNVAPVGASICRSGRTTGWRCGVVQAMDVTVNYAAGPVYGTTQTNACAEGGDSGGSFISGNQAQGVTSGGSGNCSSGGTTFFQPINPILSTFGLTLKVAGGGDTREIVSNLNGKCIDVPRAEFVDGARLQMWDCNGTVAQKWTFTGGTLRAGGKCMDVAWANPANGTAVQLANCNGNLAQQFVLSSAGDLVSVLANKCVDIAGWDSSSGAKLIIWPCHGGANQKWHTR